MDSSKDIGFSPFQHLNNLELSREYTVSSERQPSQSALEQRNVRRINPSSRSNSSTIIKILFVAVLILALITPVVGILALPIAQSGNGTCQGNQCEMRLSSSSWGSQATSREFSQSKPMQLHKVSNKGSKLKKREVCLANVAKIAQCAQKDEKQTLEDNLIRPNLQSAGLYPPSIEPYKSLNPEFVGSYNILGAYFSDELICEQYLLTKFISTFEQLKGSQNLASDFKIDARYVQPISDMQFQHIPQKLFEVICIQELLANYDSRKEIGEQIKKIVEEKQKLFKDEKIFLKYASLIRQQIQNESVSEKNAHLPLLESLAEFFEKDLPPSLALHTEQEMMKVATKDPQQPLKDFHSKLPQNYPVREIELWDKRKTLVRDGILRNIPKDTSSNSTIPAVIFFQELVPHQYHEFKKMLPKNWTWVSFTNDSGIKTDDVPFDKKINKQQDGHGLTVTTALSEHWEVLDTKIKWISQTPDVPSRTEGGSTNPRTIMGVIARNKLTGRVQLLVNSHVDTPPGTHEFSSKAINNFINTFKFYNGKEIDFVFADDHNSYFQLSGPKSYSILNEGKKDFRDRTNDEYLGFFGPPQVMQASFGGYPRDFYQTRFFDNGIMEKNILDHIMLSPDTKTLYSFRDPVVFDDKGEEVVPLSHPEYVRLMRLRNFASDHFMHGVVTLHPKTI